jgi:hypothetical protein
MSGASAVGSSGDGVVQHPTTSTAAIVVSRRCFISLQLSAFPTFAAVFAEEVGGFGVFVHDGKI